MAKISIQQRSINRKKLLPYFLKMPNFDPRIFIFSRCQKNMKKIVHNIYNKAHPNWPCDFHHNISFLVCFFLCYNQFFKMPFKLFLTQKSIFRCFWMVLMYWCQEWKTNLKKNHFDIFSIEKHSYHNPKHTLVMSRNFSATLIPWKALEANSKIPNWVQEFNPFR
jgi:hypothetical protein